MAERSQFELSGDFPVADWDRPGRGDDAKEKGTERQSARSRVAAHGYFLIFVFFVRAAEPYRLLKHFRHRRSRRLMKLGARSLLPQ